ncbi:MAG: YjfB family protein [Anaerovibrio sp.]|nr:YjfB family protein [Selenomonadaceae bacterium]MDY6053395.1 YjfB family protein [Anaerovibrio sp.]
MGFDMDIAAMSINMHQQQNNIQLGTAVMKMAMETSEAAMTDMLDSIDVSALTGVGGMVDILA